MLRAPNEHVFRANLSVNTGTSDASSITTRTKLFILVLNTPKSILFLTGQDTRNTRKTLYVDRKGDDITRCVKGKINSPS